MGSYRVCLCYTRRFQNAELKAPADVKALFEKYTEGGSQYMTVDQLRRFLVEAQGDSTAAIADAEKIVAEVLRRRWHIAKYTRNSLSLDDFFFFLFSVDLNPPFKSQVHQDMTHPLSHYFIYTGHNSYLTGNQLTSECSDRLIIKALKQGVRVIELDLWPSSSCKDNINVLHGRTLTPPVDLVTCLRAIREYAFDSSDYPVIITLEDHLTPELQAIAAKMITETIGDLLYCPKTESLKEFPSPEELKGKILISTKPPKECLEAENVVANKGSRSERKAKHTNHVNPAQLEIKALQNDNELISTKPPKECLEAENVVGNKGSRSERKAKHTNHVNPAQLEIKALQNDNEVDQKDYSHQDSNISQHLEPHAYNSLIAIRQRNKCKLLKDALTIDPDTVCRVSLSEQKLEKAIKTSHEQDLVRFTQRNILRIYPKGSRFNSSNYDPFNGWEHGAQMVAFNMQGHGHSLWQMHGMFRANGGCGYVKKPDFLLNDNQVFDPKAKLPVKTTLKVKVYMSDGWRTDFKKTHFDKYSPPDFYTKVGIAGVATDETMKMTAVKDDQWNPVWNEEFAFPLTVPELALLRIEVYEFDKDKKDDFGGQICLPVSELKPGIHTLPLYSRKGERYNSVKLLLRFLFQ